MSGKFSKPAQGTMVEDWDLSQDISGQEPDFYHASYFTHQESINRFWEVDRDRMGLDHFSLILESTPSFKKEEPVLKFLTKEQEGHSLTFQKWKGIVKEVLENTFIAHITDLSYKEPNDLKVPDEKAEFDQTDISNDDKELLSVGAVFYWCIGYTISTSGQHRRTSFLRFQRLPIYSQETIKKITTKVSAIQKLIQ